MDFILNLCKIAGAFAAVMIGIGMISKADLPMLKAGAVEQVAEMSMAAYDTDKPVDLSSYERPRVERRRPTASNVQRTRPSRRQSFASPAAAPSSREVTSSTRRSKSRGSNMSDQAIEDWIQLNVAQTYLEAEQETMSPGVILATGVYFLQQGSGDASMTAADVAAYLTEVRQSASVDAKARMKYIANSEQWFEGLNLAGFDGDKIADIFVAHQLKAFDKQMFSRHVERKIEREDYATEDELLAAERESRDADLADAYNDYASKPEVRAKHGLPTRVAAAPMSTREVSTGRREAELIGKGDSKTYDDPRLFWSVLQEMIALENDYPNWNDYKAEHPQAADREFQLRSDIMATGGVMKVTRKGGA